MPGTPLFRRLEAWAKAGAAILAVAALAVLAPAVPGGAQGTQTVQPAFRLSRLRSLLRQRPLAARQRQWLASCRAR
jgi:hypothetical protein